MDKITGYRLECLKFIKNEADNFEMTKGNLKIQITQVDEKWILTLVTGWEDPKKLNVIPIRELRNVDDAMNIRDILL